MIDEDSGAMAGSKGAELEFLDAQHKLHKQFGIKFSTCPKSGRNQHSLVEPIIKSVQETFEESGVMQIAMNITRH